VRRLVTSQVPIPQTQGTANNAPSAFVSDFSPVLVGMRTTFRVVPLRERYAEARQVAFIGWMRADVQLARADSLQSINGVTP
jgi:HK97 family phage major capsid protein